MFKAGRKLGITFTENSFVLRRRPRSFRDFINYHSNATKILKEVRIVQNNATLMPYAYPAKPLDGLYKALVVRNPETGAQCSFSVTLSARPKILFSDSSEVVRHPQLIDSWTSLFIDTNPPLHGSPYSPSALAVSTPLRRTSRHIRAPCILRYIYFTQALVFTFLIHVR